MTKLAGHVQNLNETTIDHLRRALYPGLKVMTHEDPQVLRDRVLPAYDEVGVARPFLWVRVWVDVNEQKEWVLRGTGGAHLFYERTAPEYEKWSSLTDVVESVNEYIPWSDDDMRRLDEMESELVRLYHVHGNRVIVGNFAVGWPNLEHWPFYSATMAHADFLGLHEYSWPEGVDANDGQAFVWHAWRVMRFKKARQVILGHGMRLPPIIISELGWDRAVWQGGNAGFRNAPDPNAYYHWLASYDARITADTDVLYAAIFQTGAAEDWRAKGFDVVGHYVGNVLADHVRVEQLQMPPIPEEPVSGDLTAYEQARGKRELAALPATMKWCDERGYVWRNEWSDASAGFVYCLAWDPKMRSYRQLKGDSKVWKVVADEPM